MDEVTIILLPARINKGRNEYTTWSYVEVLYDGRWRGLQYYGCSYANARRGIEPSSRKVQKEMERLLLARTGRKNTRFEFEWQKANITAMHAFDHSGPGGKKIYSGMLYRKSAENALKARDEQE